MLWDFYNNLNFKYNIISKKSLFKPSLPSSNSRKKNPGSAHFIGYVLKVQKVFQKITDAERFFRENKWIYYDKLFKFSVLSEGG